jgi:hypothetical protein
MQRRKFLKSTAATMGAACLTAQHARGAEEESPVHLGDLVAKYFHQSGRS